MTFSSEALDVLKKYISTFNLRYLEQTNSWRTELKWKEGPVYTKQGTNLVILEATGHTPDEVIAQFNHNCLDIISAKAFSRLSLHELAPLLDSMGKNNDIPIRYQQNLHTTIFDSPDCPDKTKGLKYVIRHAKFNLGQNRQYIQPIYETCLSNTELWEDLVTYVHQYFHNGMRDIFISDKGLYAKTDFSDKPALLKALLGNPDNPSDKITYAVPFLQSALRTGKISTATEIFKHGVTAPHAINWAIQGYRTINDPAIVDLTIQYTSGTPQEALVCAVTKGNPALSLVPHLVARGGNYKEALKTAIARSTSEESILYYTYLIDSIDKPYTLNPPPEMAMESDLELS